MTQIFSIIEDTFMESAMAESRDFKLPEKLWGKIFNYLIKTFCGFLLPKLTKISKWIDPGQIYALQMHYASHNANGVLYSL